MTALARARLLWARCPRHARGFPPAWVDDLTAVQHDNIIKIAAYCQDGSEANLAPTIDDVVVLHRGEVVHPRHCLVILSDLCDVK